MLDFIEQCNYDKTWPMCLKVYYNQPSFFDFFFINFTTTKQNKFQEFFPTGIIYPISIFFLILSVYLKFKCYKLHVNRPVMIYADYLAPSLCIFSIFVLCTAWYVNIIFPRFPYPNELQGICIDHRHFAECMKFTIENNNSDITFKELNATYIDINEYEMHIK